MDPNQNYDQTPQTPSPPSPEPPIQPPESFNPQPQEPAPAQYNPQPDGLTPAPQKTNGVAIAGLIFAFLLPLIGLILSIIGLNKANKIGGSGKGLSIAGIVISLIIMLLSVPILIIAYNGVQKRIEEKAAPTQASNQELGEVYNEKSGVYSVKLPKGWQVEQEGSDSGIVAFPPEGTNDFVTTAIVNVEKKIGDETLASIVASEKENISNSPDSQLKSGKDITINGVKGHAVTGVQKDGADTVEIYSVLLVKGDSIYRLTYGTSSDRINKLLPIFEASAQTFTIK